MSGEQWVCETCLPRGGSGGPPPEKVSALRLILVGFGNQALVIYSTCTCKLPVKSGTGDCGYRYR